MQMYTSTSRITGLGANLFQIPIIFHTLKFEIIFPQQPKNYLPNNVFLRITVRICHFAFKGIKLFIPNLVE